METAEFLVQGSSLEPYEVVFKKRADANLSAYCTCMAGLNGSHCKHRINILKGVTKDVVQDISDFQEINLNQLSDQEVNAYKHRIMVLLDFPYTSANLMKGSLRNLLKYAKEELDTKVELGLSINDLGIVEVLPFTRDRDAFAQALVKAQKLQARSSNRIKIAEKLQGTDMNKIMTQFVNYLSAFSGKKSVVLVSQGGIGTDQVTLKDIATTCLLHKINFNIIMVQKPPALAEFREASAEYLYSGTVGGNSKLAVWTGGFTYNGNERAVGKRLDSAIEKTEHYYRIRYYSHSANPKFRKVNVHMNDDGLLATTFRGYDPSERAVPPATALATLKPSSFKADLNLSMDTKWLNWDRVGLSTREARVAIAMRGYDELGRLVGEKVNTNLLVSKKKKGIFPTIPFSKEYALNLQSKGITRLEFVIVDMNKGTKVVLQKNFDQT
jgi:VWFA-related protein